MLQHGKSGWRINMTSDLYYVPAKHSALKKLNMPQNRASLERIQAK